MPVPRPVGAITRGTTNPNRLRRIDRWLTGPQAWRLRAVAEPLVVDLGYGASPVTTIELADRLARVAGLRGAGVDVVGIEIDPARVEAAQPLERPGVRFVVGGFEIPDSHGRLATVIRAANVLRQYDEGSVPGAWHLLRTRLSRSGVIVDATCDELGRRATWIALDVGGPLSLTISLSLSAFDLPSDVAERLPKALIHRNVPGERVHDYLRALDRAWTLQAPLAAYGRRQRFVATIRHMRDLGWPILDGPTRWRLGEVTVDWNAVAPVG